MSHMEFASYESEQLHYTKFERWATKVEDLIGLSLDGDQATDGYSLDDGYSRFKQGWSPRKYVNYLIHTGARI